MNKQNVVAALLVLAAVARAEFAGPTYAPVDRLIVNTTAFLKEHPDNAQGHYTLARIHYLAFINKATLVGVTSDKSPPEVAPDWLLGGGLAYHARRQHALHLVLAEWGRKSIADLQPDENRKFWPAVQAKAAQLAKQGWQPERPDQKQLLAHAGAAAASFRQAMKLRPADALYCLGLASLGRQYLQFAKETDVAEPPAELDDMTPARVRKLFYAAYSLNLKQALKLRYNPKSGFGSVIAYEAGKTYLALAQAAPTISRAEARQVENVKKTIERMEKLPPGPITPIVFSRAPHGSVAELLEPGSTVSFDLDGDGAAELWPWVKPTTGILVWDPDRRGEIVSGRQMFGSASWWIFFANGYHALDALDDSRDGALTGAELDGIAVWFDANSNARSEPGEVRPLGEVGVRSVLTRQTGEDGGMPMNSAGIVFTDGKTAPTYDWIASPAPNGD